MAAELATTSSNDVSWEFTAFERAFSWASATTSTGPCHRGRTGQTGRNESSEQLLLVYPQTEHRRAFLRHLQNTCSTSKKFGSESHEQAGKEAVELWCKARTMRRMNWLSSATPLEYSPFRTVVYLVLPVCRTDVMGSSLAARSG